MKYSVSKLKTALFQIQKLLDAFMKDTGISHDQIITALNDMNKKQDIKEMFQVNICILQ